MPTITRRRIVRLAVMVMAIIAQLHAVLSGGEATAVVPATEQSDAWIQLPTQERGCDADRHAIVTYSAWPNSKAMKIGRWEEGDPFPIEVDGCDPRDFRRSFSVEKGTFLLGEPILVRFAVELAGDGEWEIDDWFYHHNRDETFFILLRDETGKWVDDRYHRDNFYGGGGRQQGDNFSRCAPEVHWLPVQQYCGVTCDGVYDVYCIKCRTDMGVVLNSSHSPLPTIIPPEVREQASKQQRGFVNIDAATDYSHFRIRIVQGSEADRQAMICAWNHIVVAEDDTDGHRSRPNATTRAWEYSLQTDFLPHLREHWSQYHFDETKSELHLVELSGELDRWNEVHLTRTEAARRIPELIELLADPASLIRSSAEFNLRQATGVAHGHTWCGVRSNRPTLDEARAIQRQWTTWWAAHRQGFVVEGVQK